MSAKFHSIRGGQLLAPYTPIEPTEEELRCPTTLGHKFMPYAVPWEYRYNWQSQTGWSKIAEIWFFTGKIPLVFRVKPGIHIVHAVQHLWIVLNSCILSHEDKMCCAAFLMDRWFEEPKMKGPPWAQ